MITVAYKGKIAREVSWEKKGTPIQLKHLTLKEYKETREEKLTN